MMTSVLKISKELKKMVVLTEFLEKACFGGSAIKDKFEVSAKFIAKELGINICNQLQEIKNMPDTPLDNETASRKAKALCSYLKLQESLSEKKANSGTRIKI